SLSPNEPFGAGLLLMNGVPQPSTLRLKAGTKYRMRFINITPTMDNLRVSLTSAGVPVEWRLIAKDASDVKGQPMQKAEQAIAAGAVFDAYVLGYRIPNLARDLFAEGALSSAFVPTFTRYLSTKSHEEVRELSNIAGTMIMVVVGVLVAAGMLFAPGFVEMFAS